MKTEFFTTRTQARAAAKLAGVKLIDNGTNSAPGQRWAIHLPSANRTAPVNEPAAPRPVMHLHRRHTADRKYPFSNRASTAIGSNGRKIPVEWRKRPAIGIPA